MQWRSTADEPGTHDLLMVGPRGGGRHFELTRDPAAPLDPPPTVDDPFVVYLGEPPDEALSGWSRPAAPGSSRTTRTGTRTG
ncbi:hypothetical protein GCM10017562_72580 [Streptomyces roseofulvus]